MSNDSGGGGIGIGTVLLVVFVVLKLVGTIDWSWWWVTSPLWITILIAIFILFLADLCRPGM